MTVSAMEQKLEAIRSDGEDDGWYEDVHLIDTELENLGRSVEEKGAATP